MKSFTFFTEKSEPELKHRVSVTVSDPQHSMASKRKDKIEKFVRLRAKDENHAEVLAKHHFKKQGYKVHDSNYIGIVESNLDEISANTAMSYLHKTYDTKGYKDHTPQTKKGIDRATRKVSQDAMRRDYERSSKLGLSTEEAEVSEAVTVKKQNYSWGKMVTVHHGSETSYPLHPEHQAKIKALKPGEKTSFKDETNRTVHAERDGDKVHLSSKNSSSKTTVAHSHFTEEINEISNELLQRYKQKAGAQVDNPSTPSKIKLKRGIGHLHATAKQMISGKPMPKVQKEQNDAPFEGGKKASGSVKDKSGAIHTAMSRAKHLAKMAASKQKVSPKKFKGYSSK